MDQDGLGGIWAGNIAVPTHFLSPTPLSRQGLGCRMGREAGSTTSLADIRAGRTRVRCGLFTATLAVADALRSDVDGPLESPRGGSIDSRSSRYRLEMRA